MQQFKPIHAPFLVLPHANIDTDQIIPARFLKITDKEGLGAQVFSDWRYDREGQPLASSPLNQPNAPAAKVLVAGDNFGCGSSREHAAWALLGFGFEAVISTSFGDIFRANALRNGLLPISVSPSFHEFLLASPELILAIDLESQTIVAGDRQERFEIEAFARYCLLAGQDHLDYLLSLDQDINSYEGARV